MKFPKATATGALVFGLTLVGAAIGRQVAIDEYNQTPTPASVTESTSPSPFPSAGILATMLPRPTQIRTKKATTTVTNQSTTVDESPEPVGPPYVAPVPSYTPHSPRPSRTNIP